MRVAPTFFNRQLIHGVWRSNQASIIKPVTLVAVYILCLSCQEVKETLEHICWTCPCAQACWQKLICHWTGECWELGRLESFLANCANRCAPSISTVVQAQLERCHPDEATAYTAVYTRIWHILSSVCFTRLWMQRNELTFQQEDVTIAGEF